MNVSLGSNRSTPIETNKRKKIAEHNINLAYLCGFILFRTIKRWNWRRTGPLSTNLVIVLHALSLLFWHFIKTSHFCRYGPSSPSTKVLQGLLRTTILLTRSAKLVKKKDDCSLSLGSFADLKVFSFADHNKYIL